MATITIWLETVEIDGESHKRLALTGDTFDVKDVIKAHNWKFSDDPVEGKAWRTPAFLDADLKAGKVPQILAMCQGLMKDMNERNVTVVKGGNR